MAAALNGLVSRMVAGAFWRRGFHEPALVTRWRSVVGETLAAETVPLRIAFRRGEKTGGTLHVRVDGAYALELQHTAPLVIERLNGYYGYAAIGGLALHQGPVRRIPARQRAAKPDAPATARAPRGQMAVIDGIEDQGLKTALRKLGETLQSEPPPPAR